MQRETGLREMAAMSDDEKEVRPDRPIQTIVRILERNVPIVGPTFQNIMWDVYEPYKREMTAYVKAVTSRNEATKHLILLWTYNSAVFNRWGYAPNRRAKAALLARNPEFREFVRRVDNTGDELQAAERVINFFNLIILNAPKTALDMVLFRVTSPSVYEFEVGAPRRKFTSYTLVPFGDELHQDLLSLKHFHKWKDCCFSVTVLPAGSSSLFIPLEASCCAVSEVVLPLGTTVVETRELGARTYVYRPIITETEVLLRENLNPAVRGVGFELLRESTKSIETLHWGTSDVAEPLRTWLVALNTPTGAPGGAQLWR